MCEEKCTGNKKWRALKSWKKYNLAIQWGMVKILQFLMSEQKNYPSALIWKHMPHIYFALKNMKIHRVKKTMLVTNLFIVHKIK